MFHRSDDGRHQIVAAAGGSSDGVERGSPFGLAPARAQCADARDLFPVAGWNDKAFRYLASAPWPLPPPEGMDTGGAVVEMDAPCTWRGRPARYTENGEQVGVTVAGRPVYEWRKGEPWAEE